MVKQTVTLALGMLLTALPAAAQQPAQQAAPKPGFSAALHADLSDLESKYVKLAEAMAAKLSYRPAEGVRSAGEVFTHVAAANYMLANAWGAAPPAGTDMAAISKLTDAAQIVDALKKSFTHLHSALDTPPEGDLDKAITLFGQQTTVGRAKIMVLTHMHEHLGQSIAYARASGVTPPWSTGG